MEALEEILIKYEGKTIVVGTHGTALSTIMNFYNKDFGIEDFLRIVNWMPFIVEMIFEGNKLTDISELSYVDKNS